MLQIERKKRIMELLKKNNIIKIAELQKYFPDISKMTLWRDIKSLVNEDKIIQLHGGIMLKNRESDKILTESDFDKRIKDNSRKKSIIADKAKELIKPGDSIILDASSTSYYLAEAIQDLEDIKIITNNVKIANDFTFSDTTEVILCGGVLKKETASLIGNTAIEFFEHIRADWFFFSVSGLTVGKGCFDLNMLEVEVKKAMLKAARKKVLLIDSTKFKDNGNHKVADIKQLNYCISDTNRLPVNFTKKLKEHKIKLL